MTNQEIEDRQHKEIIRLAARAKARKMERERQLQEEYGKEYEDLKLNWVEKSLIASVLVLVVGLVIAYHWWVR